MPNKGKKTPKQKGKRPTKRGNKNAGRNLIGGLREPATSLSCVSEGYMPLFPPRTHKWLRYHTNFSLTSTVGAISTYIFRANDLFDPDFTSTGHQPMGFDQMMVFFNHFAVDRCKITVTASNQAATTMRYAVRLDASSTPITNQDTVVEFGGIHVDTLETKGLYGSTKTVSKVPVDIAHIQGIPRRNITTDPNLRGDAGTSPLEITYWHVLVFDPLGNTGTVDFDVTIDYGAYFMEPRDATASLSMMNLLLGPEAALRGPSSLKPKKLFVNQVEDDVESLQSYCRVGTNAVEQKTSDPYVSSGLMSLQPCNNRSCRFYQTFVPHENCCSKQQLLKMISVESKSRV